MHQHGSYDPAIADHWNLEKGALELWENFLVRLGLPCDSVEGGWRWKGDGDGEAGEDRPQQLQLQDHQMDDIMIPVEEMPVDSPVLHLDQVQVTWTTILKYHGPGCHQSFG